MNFTDSYCRKTWLWVDSYCLLFWVGMVCGVGALFGGSNTVWGFLFCLKKILDQASSTTWIGRTEAPHCLPDALRHHKMWILSNKISHKEKLLKLPIRGKKSERKQQRGRRQRYRDEKMRNCNIAMEKQ